LEKIQSLHSARSASLAASKSDIQPSMAIAAPGEFSDRFQTQQIGKTPAPHDPAGNPPEIPAEILGNRVMPARPTLEPTPRVRFTLRRNLSSSRRKPGQTLHFGGSPVSFQKPNQTAK